MAAGQYIVHALSMSASQTSERALTAAYAILKALTECRDTIALILGTRKVRQAQMPVLGNYACISGRSLSASEVH
jgi:hypothetical protein